MISLLALTLVLGGTAVAATVGGNADSKADAKLVKSLAPTLNVKHAVTADKVSVGYEYTLPTVSGVNRQLFNFPGLPAGRYYASFSVVVTPSTAGKTVGCYFTTDGGSGGTPGSYGVQADFGNYMSVAESDFVDASSHAVQLDCFSGTGTFTLANVGDGTASFLPVGSLTASASTLAASARKGASSNAAAASRLGR